jgi:IclR family acetate operon transcriptional repressor
VAQQVRADEANQGRPADGAGGRRVAESKYGVDSVRRALDILRAVAERGSLSLDDAVAVTGSAKSTAFRLLDTLQEAGLVERMPTGGYRPGAESVRWGLLLLGRLDVPNVAAEDLRALWLETGETVGLAMLSGKTIVLTEILESPSPFRMAELPGTVISPHSSALGYAIVANLPPAQAEEVLGLAPYRLVTANSPTSRADVGKRLDQVRSDGYALDIEESATGVACVAAAVFKHGQVAGGISIAGPRVRMSDQRLAGLGKRVAAVAVGVSRRLSPDLDRPDRH